MNGDGRILLFILGLFSRYNEKTTEMLEFHSLIIDVQGHSRKYFILDQHFEYVSRKSVNFVMKHQNIPPPLLQIFKKLSSATH